MVTMARQARTLVAAAAVSALLAGCSGSAAQSAGGGGEERPIRIGMLIPTGGVFAEVGEDIRNGFELYGTLQDGKLGGLTYEVIVEDTKANPDTAVRKAEKLIGESDIDVAVGIVASSEGVAVREVFDRRRVPVIVTNSNVNSITCEDKTPYLLRTSASFFQQGYWSGRWMAESVTTDGLALAASDYVGGRDMLAAFKEGLIDGGGSADGIVAEIYTPFQKTNDYQPFISNISASGATHTWAFYGGGEAINFVNQYEAFGLKESVPLYGWGALADDSILKALGDAALGIEQIAYYSPTLDNPTNEAFVKAYRAEFGEVPSYYAEAAYVAAQVIDMAVENLGGQLSDGEALTKSLNGVGTFDAPRGEFTMDPETHNYVGPLHSRVVEANSEGELVNAVIDDNIGEASQVCPGN